jgi:protein MPE1
VAKGGPKKPTNVPDHDPPQGYICYRCGEKGHWIQLCPTNDNPEYDNRPRVKRTTGIPRSFLKTVDKATALGQNGDGADSKTPSGVMVNADGEFVIAEPDKAAWEQFQAKAKVNPTAQKASAEEDREIRERGLECPVDNKMFLEPMKTPCCEKTYCNDCITNALIESDFVCPSCKTEGVLIDDLKPDEEAVEKIKAFLAEKDGKAKERSKSPKSAAAQDSPATADGETVDSSNTEATKAKSKSPSPASTAPATTQAGHTTTSTPTSTMTGEQTQASKKRAAEDPLENPKIPKAPKAMQKAQETQQQNMMGQMMPGMPMMGGNFGPMGGMPNMNMAMMNPMMNPMMGMAPNGFNGMNMAMMNPMMNPMMGMTPNGFNGMNGMAGPGGYNNGGWVAGPGGGDMGVMNMNGNGARMNGGMGMGMGSGYGGGPQHGQQQGPHFQQQHTNFTYQPADEEDAYFRKPVNPHRHQNRQRRVRPSDYREL